MDEILKNILISFKNILILVICVGFLGAGMLKMVELPALVAEFNYWGFPVWVMYVIGLIEIVLAIGVFYLPTRIPSLFAFIALMTGALLVHIVYGEYNFLIAPIFLSTLCAIIIYLESRIVKNQ